MIRVTETGSSSLPDTCDNTFTIAQGTGTYYVNDGTFAPGDLTTAPAMTPTTASPREPKATFNPFSAATR